MDGCATMCDAIVGCIFANSYFDAELNATQDVNTTVPLLTCTLFGVPLTAANATNCGDPAAPTIFQSYGFGKPDATIAPPSIYAGLVRDSDLEFYA